MSDSNEIKKGERIAKVLARAGVGSRRGVEALIAQGRICQDGEVIKTPATFIVDTRGITVDGEPVAGKEKTRLWRYHKPVGLVTTNNDPEGRATVFEALPTKMKRVISVGRLDMASEGLLLLTNDGTLARWMELPATGWKRRYRVRVYGNVREDALKALAKGIRVEDMSYGPIEAKLERRTGSNSWLEVNIREGKNREVRKVMEQLGLRVNRLIRVAFGPFQLGQLKEGDISEFTTEAIRSSLPKTLLDQLDMG